MKKVLILSLFLAGCMSSPVTTKLKVVTPPAQMYDCPIKKQWPNWRTLNDTEVARTVVELYKNNTRCKASIDAIQKFLTSAKTRIER